MKAIVTKYHGPTNTRGSRVTASDCDGNRVTVSYDCSLISERAHAKAAIALCKKMGWYGDLQSGALGTGYVFTWMDSSARYSVTR
jgi:hypothetical protein